MEQMGKRSNIFTPHEPRPEIQHFLQVSLRQQSPAPSAGSVTCPPAENTDTPASQNTRQLVPASKLLVIRPAAPVCYSTCKQRSKQITV